ncbi:MAG: hypothetical protein C5B51_17215 [Terriglobia bacterium]|nr:MAG: hypothetical protein C5B51_17215 [Terriglobia bacterium]
MAAFPKLKTGSLAQYPANRKLRFRNQLLGFLDGTQQRYRDSSGSLRMWDIRLDQLDETEMAALDEFFLQNQGRFGTFEFTDPWDGSVYTSCSFASDEMSLSSVAEIRGSTSLRIVQNPE